jgi:CubicO group peptidase (beta-lactamase class C family)
VPALQVIKGFLHQHKVIDAQISGAEKHRYQITLAKDQFAEFRLVQKGIDLMVTTFNTTGDKVEVFDFSGNFGEEIATITSDVSGTYWLEIQIFAETQLTTNYSVELKRISVKAHTLSKKVDQYLARWDSETSPGLAIAVSKGGKLFHSKGFGLANLEYAMPINSSTVFDVASISKQFTAFSILLLAEEGKLSIDDEVRKYLPELHNFEHKITLQHLLHHTSGLCQENILRLLAGWREDDITTPEMAFKLITMQNELNFVPGEKFEYSNSGYFLLAQVVSRVSWQSFAAFTKERIFTPLAMDSSAFPSDYRTVIKNKAYSYRLSADGFSKSILISTMIGSTGLNTTVEDLAKWANNFEQPKVGILI